ncbi:MAG: hypothetical protein HC819_06895 [Cyclobacteriaceae bacterium]|nr:hypothetical protein [Cyclobacteriaceae bacterium]
MKEMILSEEELVKRCIDNDRHAQGFLFNQHYCDLYLIAMRYMSDHHDAEDVVIGSFTRVYKYLKTFTYTSPGSLGRWIRTILINEAIRNLKKAGKSYSMKTSGISMCNKMKQMGWSNYRLPIFLE